MPDMLITAAEKIKGVYVDAIRPHTGLLEAHRELELIDHIAAADGKMKKLQVLVDEAPRVLRVGWCTVVRLTKSGPERIVGSHGAPETQAAETPWLPLEHAEALDATGDWVPQLWRDMDTTLVAAPLGDPAHRGGARPTGRSAIPAVGGGPAGLPGRHRRDDPALSPATGRHRHERIVDARIAVTVPRSEPQHEDRLGLALDAVAREFGSRQCA